MSTAGKPHSAFFSPQFRFSPAGYLIFDRDVGVPVQGSVSYQTQNERITNESFSQMAVGF
jgi:hypothetical protein